MRTSTLLFSTCMHVDTVGPNRVENEVRAGKRGVETELQRCFAAASLYLSLARSAAIYSDRWGRQGGKDRCSVEPACKFTREFPAIIQASRKENVAHAAGLRELASSPSSEKNSTQDEASYWYVASTHARSTRGHKIICSQTICNW